MRYRKAKNYKEKMSVFEGKTYIDLSLITKLDIKEAYANNQPLMLEIGCGKGGFLLELARRNPEVNYLGIEKNDALLLEAVTKAFEENLDNIKFVSFDASKIEDYFTKGDVCRIYLNFSDPWPKARHHRRRLTSRCFLSKYTEVLNESKSLIFKTDNRNLFEFTLLELSARKDSLISVDLDLHSKDFESDDERLILTEYEKRFMAQKLPIYRLEAQLLGNNRL
ncbi:tRNA (guanine-N(7)-)-methyltransferase (tRNA(m7G46)-methyltransferase) [Acetoanaerobium sticklandii]|uniref:tRNA (guanine-N(7)-)-methyltransferase n=1 Tax=Acetoanaerobium sticklandii (strain ATCC 12662 / DSM 519 / JCM 1433 / CCUG 9281 / NCIMB 10654 / HF) TaxID=499177 RepID=E3PT51_ACESD|nr:tRNA (guanosine(46)-N7)-methyltransferase TrmB [Acetoanaerobium sticklandii]CBH22055.1 tRNA (guanine-N(7)-)-methyltransferase (tRNA(m7G46)-methyltransferase) [Acetoanaerobium sticklandii]